jgi:hypothetical protein
MIRAGLEGAGHVSVHAYTSPHLVRFHERIRLAGDLIAEDTLSDMLDRCLAANGPDPITYFEITTAAAFVAFAETPADILPARGRARRAARCHQCHRHPRRHGDHTRRHGPPAVSRRHAG